MVLYDPGFPVQKILIDDFVIDDFVTFAQGVKCNVNVTIENHVYVGTGAIIRPDRNGRLLSIGEVAEL